MNVLTRRRAIGMSGGLSEINLTCPAITPTLGTEIVSDPGLEGTYTGGLNAALTKQGSPNVAESADVHGGSKAQQFQPAAQFNRLEVYPARTLGTWYQASIWGKRTAGTGNNIITQINDGTTYATLGTVNDATYTQKITTFRQIGAANDWRVVHTNNTSSFDTVVVDDYSFKAFTFSTMLTYVGRRAVRSGTYTCKPTVTANTQAGFAIGYTDANNLLLAYVNRNDGKAYLDQCDGGTWSTLRSDTITYSAAAVLKVIINGTTAQLFYGGTQVGADATITATGLGKAVYGFSTYASNTVGLVTTSKAVS